MSDPARDFLQLRRDAISRHASRIGILGITLVAAVDQGSGRYRLRLDFIPDRSVGGGKHDRLDEITAAELVFTTPDPGDPGREVAVDGLFAVEDLVRHNDRLEILVRFGGDQDLGRRFEETTRFTLRLIGVPDLDPFFDRVRFSLDAGAALALDCTAEAAAAAVAAPPLAIDYLARDYQSFRTLLVERLGRRLPEWRERNPADPLVTLAELLADRADQLSYHQDAVATETYLGTARRRISVRRHVRLVDYRMHEGHNARTWVHFRVGGDVTLAPGLGTLTSQGTTVTGTGTAFTSELLTRMPIAAGGQTRTVTAVLSDTELEIDRPFDPALAANAWSRAGVALMTRVGRLQQVLIAPGTAAEREALATAPKVFETLHPATLYAAHNEIPIYTWGAPVFTLPAAAEHATLIGRFPNLEVGDVVLFEAVRGPETGGTEDADPTLRHAVRITAVLGAEDPLGDDAVLGTPAPAGTLTAPADSYRITGTGFDVLRPGDLITAAGQPRRVVAVVSATELDVDRPFDPALTGESYTLGRLTEIHWHREDVLPFDLPVANTIDDGAGGTVVVDELTVARGNVVLADHGRTIGRPDRFATGTVSSSGTTVTGTGTDFTAELAVGATIYAAGQTRRVAALTSVAELTVNAPFDPPLAAGTRLAVGAPEESFTAAVDRVLTGTVSSSGTTVIGTGTEFRGELKVGTEIRVLDQTRMVAAIVSATELETDAPFDPPLADGTKLTYAGYDRCFVHAGRLRPRLARLGLTHRLDYDHDAAWALPAARIPTADPAAARPALDLRDAERVWTLCPELLASDRFDHDFVVEMTNAGEAVLRFGDGDLGRPPDPGTELVVAYRVGNGPEGNLGPDALYHVVTDQTGILAVRNPLPATGGTAPEPLGEVRRRAPGLLVAETADAGVENRFVRLAESHPQIERAAVCLHWNGSWHILHLAVRRRDGAELDDAFRAELAYFLEDDRPAAWDLRISGLDYAPLDLAFTVCLRPGAVRRRIEDELLATFTSRRGADGRTGLFHRDHFEFGQPVYLSRLLDAILAVRGVEAVDLSAAGTRFQRYGEAPHDELATGQIRLRGLELPRLDNDPANPDNGRVQFHLEGGR